MSGVFTSLVAWTTATFSSWGALGLFILAFMESSFFPVPPDVLLIPLAIGNPDLYLFYALVTTLGSVAGAIFGHWIGYHGGRPVLTRFAGEEKTQSVESYFHRYGDWAIALAAFTPIPYKVFTIASGTFQHQRRRLVGISLLARGLRFFLVATLSAFWGQQAVALLDAYMVPLTVLLILAGIVYLAWKRDVEAFFRARKSED